MVENQKTQGGSGKPSKDQIAARLTQLADLRSALVPEHLSAYVSLLSGFRWKAICNACDTLERTPPGKGPRFPPLGEMIEACRQAEVNLRTPAETEWTLDRYRLMVWFDKWMNEQVEEGASRETILASRPDLAPAWTRWKNQHLNDTIQIPAGWCDKCEGNGVWVRREQGGAQTVLPCECKRRVAA